MGHVGGRAGRFTVRPQFPPPWQMCFFWLVNGLFIFLGCSGMDASYWVGPGILGLGRRSFIPGQLSIEFANIGGWLTYGDLAMDSCAQFLAVAEHRLIKARARSVGHQLRKAGYHFGLGSCLSRFCSWRSCWCRCCQFRWCPPWPFPLLLLRVLNHSSYWERRSGSSLCCLWVSGSGGGC